MNKVSKLFKGFYMLDYSQVVTILGDRDGRGDKAERYLFSKELLLIRLRVSKRDSVLAYFILEAHEGICLFSTTEESINSPWSRDLEIKCTREFTDDLLLLVDDLQRLMAVEVLAASFVVDGKE
ncbi:MAG: hypothetical protein HQK53_15045 [Oligoflexia bacterium]|nr:hypothetical protein [Oligoflexia bacterium]